MQNQISEINTALNSYINNFLLQINHYIKKLRTYTDIDYSELLEISESLLWCVYAFNTTNTKISTNFLLSVKNLIHSIQYQDIVYCADILEYEIKSQFLEFKHT